MSSTQKSQQGPGTFELSSKKKFGKNLNKLQKPPAPPITNGTLPKGSESARNGLLLLSTKRSSSSSNLPGSGLLSNRSVQPTASGGKNQATFQKDSYNSSHDSMNEAFVGSSRQDPNKEPDAWRMAEKKAEISTMSSPTVSHLEELVTGEQAHSAVFYQDIEENFVLPSYVSENHQLNGDSFENGNSHQSHNLLKLDQNPMPIATSSRDNFHSTLLTDDDRTGLQSSRVEKDLSDRSPQEDTERARDLHIRAHHRTREFEENSGFSPRSKAIPRSLFDPYRSSDTMLATTSKIDSDLKEHRLHHPPNKLNATTNIVSVNSPVIHLSSYEDLDRGENRSSTNAPRMLYDPKSGSMVSVSENKTKKIKPRPRREMDAIENEESTTNNKKKGKVRNEINIAQRKERRGDSIDSNGADEVNVVKSREVRPMELRFPRTCGVLYLRDEKGNCYSADGCDGDRGYGCHGVPGGRIRNPVAFEKYEIEHQYEGTEGKVELSAATNKSDQMLQGYTAPEVQEPLIDWVKPNERIELLTGVEDSPTLQATAMPWAPRQSVFTVANSGKDLSDTLNSAVSVESMDDDDDTEDMCDDLEAFVGLGFDPSNMDDVMNSPSSRVHTARLDHLDLVALSLGVPVPETKRDRSIFAFGSSDTWGSTGNDAAPTDWTVVGAGRHLGSSEKQPNAGAATFLSFSSNNTWGTAGLPGFGNDHKHMAD